MAFNNTTVTVLMSNELENQTSTTGSYHVTKATSFITYSVINTIFCIFGIFGNILILIVYWKRKENTGSRTFTIALGVIDLLACLGAMSLVPLSISKVMSFLVQDLYSKYNIFLVFLSIFVLLAISIDRFNAVYKPIEYSLNSERRAKLSFVVIIPTGIFFITAHQMGLTGLVYFGIVCITIGGCFLTMIVLYGALFVKLYKRNRVTGSVIRGVSPAPQSLPSTTTSNVTNNGPTPKEEDVANKAINVPVGATTPKIPQHGPSRQQQRQLLGTARIFAVVTLIFVLSYMPALLSSQGVLPSSWYLQNSYYLNHISNPVIYGALSKRFRNDLKKLFN